MISRLWYGNGNKVDDMGHKNRQFTFPDIILRNSYLDVNISK